MIANAQLDNDKAAQTYQLELLKDRSVKLKFQIKFQNYCLCISFLQVRRIGRGAFPTSQGAQRQM